MRPEQRRDSGSSRVIRLATAGRVLFLIVAVCVLVQSAASADEELPDLMQSEVARGIEPAAIDDPHHKVYKRLLERGASADELTSVRGLHNTIRSLKAQEELHLQAQRQQHKKSAHTTVEEGAKDGRLSPLHAQRKRDAVHALREILHKYGVAPSLTGRKKAAPSSLDDEEGTIAALRRSYLDATSVEERESLMREISQANAQKRLSMPAHGYRLHRPRPKPALRDSEKLDYESSGLVHREEIRWIRERILAAESPEERDSLRQRLEAMMAHAKENRRKQLLESKASKSVDEAGHSDEVLAQAAESGNGVPEPVPAHRRLGLSGPTRMKSHRPTSPSVQKKSRSHGHVVRPVAKAKAKAAAPKREN